MKSDITISLAQVPVSKGDLGANLSHHLAMIEKSSSYNADVVVFPELSLTGYELEWAQELAMNHESSVFKELSQAAVANKIIVIAGCPLNSNHSDKPTIGAAICFPNGSVEFYSKQYLHEGEEKYCSQGSVDYSINIKGRRIALAICADFCSPEHSNKARESGADLYIASALISDSGFETDAKILSGIAEKHNLPVLLSNHISVTGGWSTCGNNSIWNSSGELVFSSESKEICLVLCTISGHHIQATKRC
ncbi:carbon-nitrogen hydrolase family protein [Vibrio sp. YIC-376]|uniref:carbon-nitrogen hydrolase family protein n=1 Tax=Vibrio sp. YIC-376 TaxID=3136162 RepID=UPI00402A808C